jgi:uncharacterized transporter YbjL
MKKVIIIIIFIIISILTIIKFKEIENGYIEIDKETTFPKIKMCTNIINAKFECQQRSGYSLPTQCKYNKENEYCIKIKSNEILSHSKIQTTIEVLPYFNP